MQNMSIKIASFALESETNLLRTVILYYFLKLYISSN